MSKRIKRRPQACHLYLTPVFQPGIPPHPKNAKRTQFPPTKCPTTQNMRNEPNSHIPRVQPPPISSKRTQFPPAPAWSAHQKCKTNPISTPTVPAPTQLCKTNPISAAADRGRSLFMQNEPNFSIPGIPPTPISSKRTQSDRTPAPGGHPAFNPGLSAGAPSAYQPPVPSPISSKRTQFAATNIQSTTYNIQFPHFPHATLNTKN